MTGRLYAGASGFSYPSWRGGFYPPDAKPDTFLRHYAERVDAVELNNTFYRVPEEDQFDRWAAQVPDGFRFAVTASRRLTSFGRVEGVDEFCRMARRLGDRLGPLRFKVPQARDDGFLRLLLDSLDPDVSVALDFRHDSWDDPDVSAQLEERGVARTGAWDAAAVFRYLRLREPPYDEKALAALAGKIQPLVADGVDVYAFFRHEDEPRAPLYAERLRELVEE
ncbi:MAG: DUF72 domain-containing protein [Gaiellaceae bacterium]